MSSEHGTTGMMKAAVYRQFGGPIRIETVPRPRLTTADSIVVQVMATGVCRSDWHGWKGHDSDIIQHGLPFVPGHELSGIVVQVGKDVTCCRPGDRVMAPFLLTCGSCHYCQQYDRCTVCAHQEQPGFTYWGSFAEYVAIPRANRHVQILPPAVSFVQAAALGCRFTTAYRAVKQQGRVAPGTVVAIFGVGGVGLSCVMMAHALQAAIIIAVDVSPAALQLAQSVGATHVVLAQDAREQVPRICPTGDGADVCIDAAGFRETCEAAVACTRPAGRMVQVGLPIGDVAPQIPMGRVAGKEIEIVGSHGFDARDLPDLLNLIARGELDPGRLVRREVSLAEGARELEHMDKSSPVGITMITSFHESKL